MAILVIDEAILEFNLDTGKKDWSLEELLAWSSLFCKIFAIETLKIYANFAILPCVSSWTIAVNIITIEEMEEINCLV